MGTRLHAINTNEDVLPRRRAEKEDIGTPINRFIHAHRLTGRDWRFLGGRTCSREKHRRREKKGHD